FPGAVNRQNASGLEFVPLVSTGSETGTVAFDDILQRSLFGGGALNPARRFVPTREEYVLAAHIHGKLPPEPRSAEVAEGEAEQSEEHELNVVVVADIDV